MRDLAVLGTWAGRTAVWLELRCPFPLSTRQQGACLPQGGSSGPSRPLCVSGRKWLRLPALGNAPSRSLAGHGVLHRQSSGPSHLCSMCDEPQLSWALAPPA